RCLPAPRRAAVPRPRHPPVRGDDGRPRGVERRLRPSGEGGGGRPGAGRPRRARRRHVHAHAGDVRITVDDRGRRGRAGAGADLAPAGATRKRGAVVAGAGETTVVTLQSGPSELRDLHLAVLAPAADALASARLRIYWDGASVPAVDAPLGFVAGDGAGVF